MARAGRNKWRLLLRAKLYGVKEEILTGRVLVLKSLKSIIQSVLQSKGRQSVAKGVNVGRGFIAANLLSLSRLIEGAHRSAASSPDASSMSSSISPYLNTPDVEADYEIEEEEFVPDYEKRVLGITVGVQLTPVSALWAELEAIGWSGVNLEGVVCVAYLEPTAAELVAECIWEEGEDSLEKDFAWRYPELAAARKVFGKSSAPRSATGEESTMVVGEAFLLSAFPPEAPEDLVREIEWEDLR